MKKLLESNNAYGILASIYTSLIIVSNIISTKIVTLGGWAFDGGTIIYPITFAVKDMIQKKFGRKVARQAIWTAFILLGLVYALFWIVAQLPADSSWLNQDAYEAILLPVGRIVLASMVAGIIAELLDTKVFSILWQKTNQLWVAFISNAVGLVLDTIIFTMIAFYGALPNDVVLQIAIVNLVSKFAVSILALPSILLVKPTDAKKI